MIHVSMKLNCCPYETTGSKQVTAHGLVICSMPTALTLLRQEFCCFPSLTIQRQRSQSDCGPTIHNIITIIIM